VDTNSETSNDEGGIVENPFEELRTPKDNSFCGRVARLWNFMIEREEYRDPQTHGWRIKFRCLTSLLSSIQFLLHPYGQKLVKCTLKNIFTSRRLCLTIGVIFFTFTTINSTINTQSYSSKDEIQKILDYTNTNLTWPDSGSALDEVFQVFTPN
jgi:hypothetical protein